MKLCEYFDTKIGLGKFQLATFIVISLVGTQDGVQMILSTFLNTILKAFYPELTSSMIQLLASVFFIGIIFGTLISSHLSDKYGRKQMVNYGSIIQIITGVSFYFANNITSLFILRFMYGFAFGFTNSITTTLLLQIMPTKYRGKSLILFSLSMTFGKMYALLLGHLFIKNNLIQTDWKTMIVLGGAPSVAALIGSLAFIQQSPRFLLSKHRFEEALIVLDKMAKFNHNGTFQQLTQSDKQDIINQFQNYQQVPDQTSYLALFERRNLQKTISLTLIWIFINLCFYGQLTIEGLHIVNKNTNLVNLKNYILTVCGELPSFIISLLMIDQPFFGRKNSITIFFLSGSIFHLLFGLSSLQIMSSVARFFMKDAFQVIDPLTTESYDTTIRSKGYGFCSGLSKVGAVVMPYIVFPLNDWNPKSVYFLFSFVMFLAALVVWGSIQQTMNKCLENVDNVDFNHEEIDPQDLSK